MSSLHYLRAIWARRGFRRLTYVLATGAVVVGVMQWAANQSYFTRWLIVKLKGVVQDETGMPLEIFDLDLDLMHGRVRAYNLAWGGDLFKADAVSLVVEPWSTFTGRLRLKKVEVLHPRIVLDASRLSRLKLKQRAQEDKFFWKVDELHIRRGQFSLHEKAWGVPEMETAFNVRGGSPAFNQLELALDTSQFRIGIGTAAQDCQLKLKGTVDDGRVVVSQGECRLAKSWAQFSGLYEFKAHYHALYAKGSLDAAPLNRLFLPESALPLGVFSFKAESLGPLSDPRWRLGLEGSGIQLPDLGLAPLEMKVSASGSPGKVALHQLEAGSVDGHLAAEGTWQKGSGSRLKLQGRSIDLHRLIKHSRVEFLKRSVAQLEGEVALPPGQFNLKHLEALEAKLNLSILRDGVLAGKAQVDLSGGECRADAVEVDFPELIFKGRASMHLDALKPVRIEAEGQADTNATQVASVLKAWDIGDEVDQGGPPDRAGGTSHSREARATTRKVGKARNSGRALGCAGKSTTAVTPFQMAGHAHVGARMTWTPKDGLLLDGECQVEEPRWHAAKVEWLTGKVEIRKDNLWVKDIRLGLGEGRGYGDLWLTWADGLPGASQVDMCYGAFHLPVAEGLKAADLDLPLSGQGSGWVRIFGNYDKLNMIGAAQAEAGKAYGVNIPALSTDFAMDIKASRMSITDLRVGESLASLGHDNDMPSGLLSLKGYLNMDFHRETWKGALNGLVDSQVLGLPGPRFQAKVEIRPDGQLVAPFGPVKMPELRVSFKGGRVFLGPQSLEDIEGAAGFSNGDLFLHSRLGSEKQDFLSLSGWQIGSVMKAVADVRIDRQTAETANLSQALSHDAMKDLGLEAGGDLVYSDTGIAWKGKVSRLDALMPSFSMALEKPGRLEGDDKAVKVDFQLLGRSDQGADLLSVALLGKVPFGGSEPVSLRAVGEAELSRLKPLADQLLELDPYSLLGDLQPAGTARFDVKLGGRFSDPLLDGQLELLGGSMKVKTYPQSIENLDFTLRFKGKEIILPEEAPAWGVMARGEFKAWGRATWGLGGLRNYDMRAKLEDFELRDLPEGLELSGRLEAGLAGSDESGGLLKGNLTLSRMLYRTDFKLMNILMSEGMDGLAGLGPSPDDPLARIALDLDLSLQEPWTCDTNFFKVQGVIAPNSVFKVKGSLAQPTLHGRMDLIQGGRLTNLLPAGDVVVERGSVTFHEASPITNPMVDFQGRVDVSPYTVNLQLSGNVEHLQPQISSTPSLRQDEIITILTDPSVAATIGTTTSTSTDMSKGLGKTTSDLLTTLALADVQDRIRKALGLDRVDVSYRPGAGGSESTYTLGKTFTMFDRKLPFVFQQKSAGDVTTRSGRFEFRNGNFVFQLGLSQSGSTSMDGSGEVRYTWSSR